MSLGAEAARPSGLFSHPTYQVAGTGDDSSVTRDVYKGVMIGLCVLLVFYLIEKGRVRRLFNWANLTASAEGLTKFIHELGVPKKWQFVDVYSMDEDMLPKNCVAFILLMPNTPNRIKRNQEEAARMRKDLPVRQSVILICKFIRHA